MMDYPYMIEHRKRPDPLLRLIAAHRSELARIRSKGNSKIVLIGKSMGSRIGCHVALEEPVHAVVCLGYPLCGGGDRTKLRHQVLRDLSTPVLFVQGTRDPLCPLDLMAVVRSQMSAPNQLEVIEGGDHSLAVTQNQLNASNQTQSEVESGIIEAIVEFVRDM